MRRKYMLRRVQNLLTYCAGIAVLCLVIKSLHFVTEFSKPRPDLQILATMEVIETSTERIRPDWVTNMTALLFSPVLRTRTVTSVNCQKLIDGDEDEIRKAHMEIAGRPRKPVPDSLYVELTQNCTEFIYERGYATVPMSQEEEAYPIAFSILMYKEVEQAERLLRSIYQPQNSYCIHIDLDSAEVVHEAMKGIAGCLPNVFIASKLENIVYGGYSRLQADINCMSDLLSKNISWKYFINQPSQAFPLRTNAELVTILKIYNGSNDIEGTSIRKLPHIKSRIEYHHAFRYPDGAKKRIIVRTARKKGNPPYSLNITKGSAYGVFSRDFVNYILHRKVSRMFLRWCKDTYSPDEHYWSTLNHLMDNPMLRTPGGYTGVPNEKLWLAAYASWAGTSEPCHGKYHRGVCIFGIEDLPLLVKRKELFANKFYVAHEHLALDCLEEYIYNRTFRRPTLNTTFYRNLPFVRR